MVHSQIDRSRLSPRCARKRATCDAHLVGCQREGRAVWDRGRLAARELDGDVGHHRSGCRT
eukprot:scaffold3731_cov149-Isochrysis_galbana.AAC.4